MIDEDDLASLRVLREVGVEYRARAESGVEHDERLADAVDLILVVDAVDERAADGGLATAAREVDCAEVAMGRASPHMVQAVRGAVRSGERRS